MPRLKIFPKKSYLESHLNFPKETFLAKSVFVKLLDTSCSDSKKKIHLSCCPGCFSSLIRQLLPKIVSVFGVFLVRIFPHLDWIWTRKTPTTEHFYTVNSSKILRTCILRAKRWFSVSNQFTYIFHYFWSGIDLPNSLMTVLWMDN